MKRIIFAALMILSTSIYAGTLEEQYAEENCGLTEDGYIDTTSKDICIEDTKARLKNIVNSNGMNAASYKDTTFSNYRKEKFSTHEHSQLQERSENLYRGTTDIAHSILFIFMAIFGTISAVLVLFNMIDDKDGAFKEYTFKKEIGLKLIALFLLLPLNNGMMLVSYVFNEFLAYNHVNDNLSARKTIDTEYRLYSGRIDTSTKSIEKQDVERSIIETMLWAYSGIRQTDKFYTEFVDEKMRGLGYDMSSAVKIKDDSIVFLREINGQNLYIGGTIPKFEVSKTEIKTIEKLGLDSYISADSSSWKSNVELIETEIANKLDKKSLNADEIKSVNTVLKLSYNKALENLVTEVWNSDDLNQMFIKSLEISCSLGGTAEAAKNYVKKLNGEGNDSNHSSQCVEEINGQYVALGIEAKLKDMNESSKYSFELQKNNNQFIINKMEEITEKFNSLRFDLANSFSSITKSNAEKDFLRMAAANPVYMQFLTKANLSKLSFNNDPQVKSILNNGLFTARNNANGNMIIESVFLSYPKLEALITPMKDIKIRKNLSDVIHENQNLKRLNVSLAKDDIETNELASEFYDAFVKPAMEFKDISMELYNNIQNGNSSFSSSVYFAERLKITSWDMITKYSGLVALNQTKHYFAKKNEARKSKVATIENKDNKNIQKKLIGKTGKVFGAITSILSVVILILTPILLASIFIADFMPVIFNIPFILALLQYDINTNLIVLIAFPIFIFTRMLIPNDNNNILDIIKRFINFPLAIMLFPFLLYCVYVVSNTVFEILTGAFISHTVYTLSTIKSFGIDTIFTILTSLFVLIWILIMTFTTSITLAANAMNLIFRVMDVPQFFSAAFEGYTQTLNNVFLKIIPFATLATGALFRLEIAPHIKNAKNKIKESALFKKISGLFK
jgi:hypothetical protein